ncbi:Rootletin isoform 1 [Schistosoma japonicum]|uniref:Rootletin isoform 1 n=1 Tax=Schistosoma japonicum TaxID=6182 RepID=A0A4Z2D3B6_SCHJA|nr:Rootletin isoform 1 [Schistosoma japonicum]
MSKRSQDIEESFKENKDIPLTMNPDEEISLDSFFQMVGMDSSQLEALCYPITSTAACTPDDVHISLSGKNSPFTHPLHSTDTEETINHIKARYEAEIANYKRKLSSYQDGQQKQAQLIQKLQAKVLQYKKSSSDLELEVEQLKAELETSNKVLQTTTETLNARIDVAETRARALEQERSYDIENTVNKLQEEQQRSNELSRTNELLRDQLEQAVQANQGLSQDVARLTLAWRHAAQQLDKRESEWREEESAFNDYFAAEHSRLLSLWRAVVALRRQFAELRQQTDKDLINIRTEFTRYLGNIQSACCNLEANQRTAEAQNQASQVKTASFIEADIANRVQGLTESLARSQARLAETETKLTEIMTAKERLATQLAERDRILTTMKQLHSNFDIDSSLTRSSKSYKRSKRLHDVLDNTTNDIGKHIDDLSECEDEDDHLKATKRLIEHTHVMHHALSQIAQLIIWDATIADTDEAQEPILNLQNPEWSSTRIVPYSLDGKHTVYDISADNKAQIEGGDVKQQENKICFTKPEDISSLRRFASSKYQAGSSLHLAESTVNAVQTALNRRATHVHRLRLRSSGLKEQINNLTRRGEESDVERKRLSEQLAKLREELEVQSLEMDKLSRERDRIKQTLSLTKEEHEMSESARQNLNEHIREIESELDRLRTSLHDMRKQRDETIAERDHLQSEQNRVLRELDGIQKTLTSTEQRAVNFREELATIREQLRRVELEKEILDQEKNDAITAVTKIQAKIEELNEDLNQARNRENQYKSRIARLETVLESQEHDAEQLTHQISLTHAKETRLAEERANLRAELQEQRDELEKLYSERSITQSELEQARESTMRAETARSRLEAELSELARERMTLTESLSEAQRQKASLMEDISTFRRDSERQEALIMRLTNEKEAISRHKAELLLQLSIVERDNRHLTEIINTLKSEKESLESSLFDMQQTIEQLYHKQSQLERDVSDLKNRRDELQTELSRAHSNFQIELEKSQRSSREVGDQLTNELQDLRIALLSAEKRAEEAENACLQAVARADQAVSIIDKQQQQQHVDVEQLVDKEYELRNSAEEMNRLTKELLTAQRERDEARLLAERERQRALSRATEEKVSLQEKVNALQETITELQITLDRTQKDASTREDQERSALRKATEEVRSFRNQLQEACSEHERENRELRMRIHSLESQRDQWTKEVSELQLQIRLAEEVRDSNRTELVDSTCRIRALEETNDSSRRECCELRQKLGELEREKNAINYSNEELRKQLKCAELERVDLVRMTNSLKSKLQGTEMDRTSSEKRVADLQVGLKEATNLVSESKREIMELRSKLQRMESDKKKLTEEIEELKSRLNESMNQEESLKREKIVLKQKLLEIEAAKSTLQSELSDLNHQMSELEEILRSRERTANQAADDWQKDYQRLIESKKCLQSKLDNSNLVISELRTLLAESQTCIKGLESELNETLTTRQEAEARLSAIHSILRRLIGFRQSQYTTQLQNLNRQQTQQKQFQQQLNGNFDSSLAENIDELEKSHDIHSHWDYDGYMKNTSGIESFEQQIDGLNESDSRRLKMMAEQVLNSQQDIKPDVSYTFRSEQMPKPRARGRRRYEAYTNSDIEYTQQKSFRRAKSASPTRVNRYDGFVLRSTSTEGANQQRLHDSTFYSGDENGFSFYPNYLTHLSDWSCRWLDTIRYHMNGYRTHALPGSNLDPGAVRLALRRFLRHLVKIERERDDFDIKAKLNEEKVVEYSRQLNEREEQLNQMKTNFNDMEKGKLEIMEQLNKMKNTITEHENEMSKREYQYTTLHNQIKSLEQQLNSCEAEKNHLQIRLEKSRTTEIKLEENRRELLHSLEEAETRYTQAEIIRRQLEGELQRCQTILSELESDKENLQSRLNMTGRQGTEMEMKIYNLQIELERVTNALDQTTVCVAELRDQLTREKLAYANLQQELTRTQEHMEALHKRELNAEQEKRLLQERLDNSKNLLNDTKVQLHEMMERVQKLQMETSDAAAKRAEVETQLKQLEKLSSECQQTNSELQMKLNNIQVENANLTEKNANLLRSMNDAGIQKHEIDCELTRVKKEQIQWRKMAEKMERERAKEQELNNTLRNENSELMTTIRRLEEETLNLRREIQKLQVHMAQQDEQYAAQLIEVNTKQRQELENELDRQRNALNDTQKTLQLKERSYKQRVRGLEDQVRLWCSILIILFTFYSCCTLHY